MSETTNYGLYLEDDASAKFQTWRQKMNGSGQSNMVKIDTALGEKADKSTSATATLLASAWVGVDAPFTQELSIEGLGAAQNGTISVAHSATAEQREIAREALLSITGQENGKLQIVADGELPEQNIPVVIILLG